MKQIQYAPSVKKIGTKRQKNNNLNEMFKGYTEIHCRMDQKINNIQIKCFVFE